MELTRYTHSCVRLERAGRALTIDPGVWSEPAALENVDAVLVTHEHHDHVDQARVAELNVPVYAPWNEGLDRVRHRQVAVGTTIQVAGFEVNAIGGEHARVVASQQPCTNVGYIIDGSIYHPGDSLHVPDRPIDTLLVPIQASWLKTVEAIDFVNEIQPKRAIGIHEAQLNERGMRAINSWLEQECGTTYRWLTPGTTIDLDTT